MGQSPTGYRAFPASIDHPSKAKRLTLDEFETITKVKMQEAPSLCVGHKATIVWYSEANRRYIVQIQFDAKPDLFAESLCTFTPTFGMDVIDGFFAQDVEALLLSEVLGVKSQRLDAFRNRESIPIMEYLQTRGFGQSKDTNDQASDLRPPSPRKRWWQFWRKG